MNWLQRISFNSTTGFIKTAGKRSTPGSMFNGCTFNGPNTFNINESTSGFTSDDDPSDTFTTVIRKNDRTASDSYRVWITKSANYQGTTLTLEVKAERDGMLAYSRSWKFAQSDLPHLENTFDALVDISKTIKNRVEQEQIPTALIGPMFKNSTTHLSPDNHEGSRGVPNYRYSLEEPIEYDWRQTVYGKRYPELQQLDPIKVELNTTQKQDVQSVGAGRNRRFKTRYDV